jgi:hypothetical protein
MAGRAADARLQLARRQAQPMTADDRPSMLGGAIRGAIAGAVATWLMDRMTTGLVEEQSEVDKAREAAAQPNGQSSVANLLDRAQEATGLSLRPGQKAVAAQAVHYGLGVVPGAVYGALRSRLPFIAAGGGLLYGMLLFALNDEVMNTELGLAGPYDAYPLSSHLRGAVGHAVLGVATDRGVALLGG